MASKQKYSPINNQKEPPQIEMVEDDDDDRLLRGPSQYDTKAVLAAVPMTPKGAKSRRVAVKSKKPVQDRVWDKLNKAVYWVYLGLALATVVMLIIGLVTDLVGSWIGMIVIVAITWIGSFVGMWSTYLTGTFEGFIDQMNKENGKFEYNLDQLKSTRGDLSKHAKGVFYEVNKLGRDAKELDQTLQQFDQLRKDLQQIAGQNTEVLNLVEDVNSAFDGMVDVITSNERASLMSIYYEVCMRDDEEGLSEEEFNRFLGRLNNRTKELFVTYPDGRRRTFADIDESQTQDGVIDLQEFEALLDEVIERQEQHLLDHTLDRHGD